MSESRINGRVSYVNYEKEFATIDYRAATKNKSINCKTAGKHYYRIDDEVSFALALSDRGDKMTAVDVKFHFNPSLNKLLSKAETDNHFNGYLKIVDETYFVKEWESYIFFPLHVSKWERPPVESAANEAIAFKLMNTDKPNAVHAELFSHAFIPAYKLAEQSLHSQKVIEALVSKVSPHAIFVTIFDGAMQGRIDKQSYPDLTMIEGDPFKILITHLTPFKLAIKPVL